MMYICDICNDLIEAEELKLVVEDYGEEHIDFSCHCCKHGTYVEAEKCSICGEYFNNTELWGVCENCLEEHETVGEALKMGEDDLVKIDGINGFVASCLSVEQINKILIKWVEENFTDHSRAVVDYCEQDKGYFSEHIEYKYKE